MKKIITIGLLLSVIGIANAQTKSNDSKVSTETFQPGWFMSLYTGYNLFLGEGNNFFKDGNTISMRKNGSPLSTFGLGYEFNPVISLRGEAGWARYHWNQTSPVTKVVNPYWWGLNFTGDLMVNISNWWGGYNPNRVFDVQVFGGLGVGVRSAHQIDTKRLVTPIVRAGIQGNFHLSKQFDLNAEIATNAVSDKFNGYKKELFFDDFTSFQVGFTYHFRKSEPVKPTVVPTPEPVIQIKEVIKHDTVYVKVPTPVAAPVKRTVTKEYYKEIFFNLNNANFKKSSNPEVVIPEAIEFLKANPSAQLAIDGYADKATGSEAYNLKISQKRAQDVADAIKKAGIDGSRLTVVGHGTVPQLYKENAKNRLVTLKSTYQVTE